MLSHSQKVLLKLIHDAVCSVAYTKLDRRLAFDSTDHQIFAPAVPLLENSCKGVLSGSVFVGISVRPAAYDSRHEAAVIACCIVLRRFLTTQRHCTRQRVRSFDRFVMLGLELNLPIGRCCMTTSQSRCVHAESFAAKETQSSRARKNDVD
jgi:hypothetical protein